MKPLFRIIENPRTCSYLPEQRASLEIRVAAEMSAQEYGDLLARGYRRFGWQLFRPACPRCAACRSLRVLVQRFSSNAHDRRVLRKNEGVRSELHPLFAAPEHVELFNRYQVFMHRHRAWPLQQASLESYCASFLSGPEKLGLQWLYFQDGRLIGVALMDRAFGAISLVYFYYDPAWRSASPGRFSILNQLLYARKQNLQYAYLGYWIENCQSMNYKDRFPPFEILDRYVADDEAPVWS
jgi:arginyl-tRNA--protein-N-Asp/Glu arginylyltransferase